MMMMMMMNIYKKNEIHKINGDGSFHALENCQHETFLLITAPGTFALQEILGVAIQWSIFSTLVGCDKDYV